MVILTAQRKITKKSGSGTRRSRIMMNINDGLYLGVDGCRGGWIACILDHGELFLKRFDSLEELTDF